jgi:hypothetical protein
MPFGAQQRVVRLLGRRLDTAPAKSLQVPLRIGAPERTLKRFRNLPFLFATSVALFAVRKYIAATRRISRFPGQGGEHVEEKTGRSRRRGTLLRR